MSTPCTSARSPLSAKNSMNTTIVIAAKNSTNHSGFGITPAAPWIRALRASSRAVRSSPHFEYASCSALVFASTCCSVSNIFTPHGLRSSPRVWLCIRAHCTPATDRA
jgi:hypothetical protein